ncbi:ABC transporter family substrate-binding protein [Galactobacter valiniphilus]|uniref:ABC transporter family substrate-binding protein n=1 Tax=Galactobacter valiniphilus TaxID=2676122 RepID=A0A399JH46_9MICC|nr:ABC transporter family substrate-binding protein [Galactobacter valiniphilus]RII43492.1 ABC transporter family substrate-binding protein [Galactobacter valiniphilus]
MRLKRIPLAVAAGAVAALALASCSPGGPSTPSSSGSASGSASSSGSAAPEQAAQIDGSGKLDLKDIQTQDGELKVSVGSTEFGGYNTLTPATYDTYSSSISALYGSGFFYFGTDGKVIPNTTLGTAEVVTDNPLQIKYTINKDAVWSDGTPITVADAVLAWGSQNASLLGADGKTPVFNNVSGDLVQLVPKGPEGDVSGKEFTVTYKEPNLDWKLQTFMAQPAHVVAKQAGMSIEDLVAALRAQDKDKLAKAGAFWSTGWNKGAGQLPAADLNVSSGPYILDSWQKGQSVTLVPNPKYWGPKAGVSKLTFRFVDSGAMVQALQNKDLDVMSPQPTLDTLKQLEALGASVKIIKGDTMTWEHVDFNFAGTSVFKDDVNLRKAFAMCIPREQIVEQLIKPLNPEAKVLNSRVSFPGDELYDRVVKDAYPAADYDKVNVEGAKKLVDESSAKKTNGKVTVRIGYNAPNPRRANEVQLIKASCDQAGFDVKDISAEGFSAEGGPVTKNDYDAFLFAWAGSGQLTSDSNIYMTGMPQNYGKYSNAEVDKQLTITKTTMDLTKHGDALLGAEKQLWTDMFSVPIFQHPGIDAAGSDVTNVIHTNTQDGITWNADQWQRVAK